MRMGVFLGASGERKRLPLLWLLTLSDFSLVPAPAQRDLGHAFATLTQIPLTKAVHQTDNHGLVRAAKVTLCV